MNLPNHHFYSYMGGYKITVAKPEKRQVRTHKKKRINKKWAKRYGYHYSKLSFDEDQIILLPDKTLLMSEKAYKKLMESENIIKGLDKLDEEIDKYASK